MGVKSVPDTYTGSQIHLFRSILQHRTEEEGFEIFEWKGSQIQASYNSQVGAISYNGEYVAVPKFLQMEMDSVPKPDKTSASISVLRPGKIFGALQIEFDSRAWLILKIIIQLPSFVCATNPCL